MEFSHYEIVPPQIKEEILRMRNNVKI
jgi:hypothetical protein